jgi:hypothetical protein
MGGRVVVTGTSGVIGSRRATRAAACATGAWGLLLLTRPDDVATRLTPLGARPPRWAVLLLGLRVTLQSAAILLLPLRGTVLAGAAVDAVHAASMLAATLRWPRLRRALLTSAVVAVTSAALQVAAAPPTRPGRPVPRPLSQEVP